MTLLHARFHIHREVLQTIDLKSLANASQHKEHLHLDHVATRTDRPADTVQEAQITRPHIPHAGITVHSTAIETLGVESISRAVEGVRVSLRLHPDLAEFADEAERVGLWVDDADLRADGDHS